MRETEFEAYSEEVFFTNILTPTVNKMKKQQFKVKGQTKVYYEAKYKCLKCYAEFEATNTQPFQSRLCPWCRARTPPFNSSSPAWNVLKAGSNSVNFFYDLANFATHFKMS